MVKRVLDESDACLIKRTKQIPVDDFDSNASDGSISDDSEDLMANAHEYEESGSDVDDLVMEQFASEDDEDAINDETTETTADRPQKRKSTAPTAQEIQELKESESLFKSNLFKFEMDELLQEVRVNYEKCSSLENAVRKLKDIFENIQDQPEAEVNVSFHEMYHSY